MNDHRAPSLPQFVCAAALLAAVGCQGPSFTSESLPKSMQTPEMKNALPELERYSLPLNGGGITVSGHASPESKWCYLPDGKMFIYLDKEELTPDSPHGVFLLDWGRQTLQICPRSDFLVWRGKVFFLNYPIQASDLDTPGAGDNLPIEFLKKDTADVYGLGFRLKHIEVLVSSPSKQRGAVWDELDRVYGEQDDPRNLDAYPEEWHDWVASRSLSSPPPRNKKGAQ